MSNQVKRVGGVTVGGTTCYEVEFKDGRYFRLSDGRWERLEYLEELESRSGEGLFGTLIYDTHLIAELNQIVERHRAERGEI